MKKRIHIGTINRHREDGWLVWDADISDRGIWDSEIDMAVCPDFILDAAEMPNFRDDTFDEVVFHHVLEHISLSRAVLVIREIRRILVPGGVLDIEVPDMDRIAEAWVSGEHEKSDLQQWLYGEDLGAGHHPEDTHRSAWSGETLKAFLEEEGFSVGDRLPTGLAVRYLAEAVKEAVE